MSRCLVYNISSILIYCDTLFTIRFLTSRDISMQYKKKEKKNLKLSIRNRAQFYTLDGYIYCTGVQQYNQLEFLFW